MSLSCGPVHPSPGVLEHRRVQVLSVAMGGKPHASVAVGVPHGTTIWATHSRPKEEVNLMRKLDVHDRSELIRYAIRKQLVEV